MSRESKVYAVEARNADQEIKELLSVGWEVLSMTDRGILSLSRDMEHHSYSKLVELEREFKRLKSERERLPRPQAERMKWWMILICALSLPICVLISAVLFGEPSMVFAVVGLVIAVGLFIFSKIKRTNKFIKGEVVYDRECKKLDDEIKEVCQKGYAIFLSKKPSEQNSQTSQN
jgi:hypothetical protein